MLTYYLFVIYTSILSYKLHIVQFKKKIVPYAYFVLLLTFWYGLALNG